MFTVHFASGKSYQVVLCGCSHVTSPNCFSKSCSH